MIFTQVLVPQNTNAVSVPPATFTFFDPRNGKYETLTEGPFRLTYHAKKAAVFERFRPEDLEPAEHAEVPVAAARKKRFNREALSTLALAGYWMLAAAAVLWLAGRRQAEAPTGRTRARRAAVAGVSLSAAALLFIPYRLVVRHSLQIGQTATLSADVIVRFAPSHGSLESFRLNTASSVRVLEAHGTWSKIASGNRRGWVPTDSVTPPAAGETAP